MTYYGDTQHHSEPPAPPRQARPLTGPMSPEAAQASPAAASARPERSYQPHQGVRPGQPPRAHARSRSYLAQLGALRSAYRRLRRVSTLTALGSFMLYVLLSCFADGLMGTKVAGELTLGLTLGLLQLLVTFAAIGSYERSARRSVDPLAQRFRQQVVADDGDPEGGR